MSVRTVNDEQLRHLIYTREYCSVKYTTATCDTCIKLAPAYEVLCQKAEYGSILFLKIDAEENPTAKQYLAELKTPLMVTYHNGKVVNISTAATVDDIATMLDELLLATKSQIA